MIEPVDEHGRPIGIGPYLKAARARTGMTQREVADAAEMDAAYYRQLETVQRRWPKKYATAIARTLGVRLSDLGRAAGRVVSDHPLTGSAIGTSTARATTLTIGAKVAQAPTAAVGNATRQFLDSLTDEQRVDLLGLINDAAKLSHAEDYQEEDEETEEEAPMTN